MTRSLTSRRRLARMPLHTFRRHKLLYLMFLPAVVYYGIFHYLTMYGVVIAFQDYDPLMGVRTMFVAPNWVGLRNFIDFFQSFYFWRLLRNTLIISLAKLAVGFPAPLLLALLLNEVRLLRFKKAIQTISYLPHFLSWVIIGGMMFSFLSLDGPANALRSLLGFEPILYLSDRARFRTILVASHVWQTVGWGSIIYLAGLASVNPELYDSARVDGANRLQQAIHISVPTISNLIAILLILSMGDILNAGFEQVLMLYNPSVYEVADIIDTFIYREGIQNLRFSYTAAVGMFKNIFGLIFVLTTNSIAKRLGSTGLF